MKFTKDIRDDEIEICIYFSQMFLRPFRNIMCIVLFYQISDLQKKFESEQKKSAKLKEDLDAAKEELALLKKVCDALMNFYNLISSFSHCFI